MRKENEEKIFPGQTPTFKKGWSAGDVVGSCCVSGTG